MGDRGGSALGIPAGSATGLNLSVPEAGSIRPVGSVLMGSRKLSCANYASRVKLFLSHLPNEHQTVIDSGQLIFDNKITEYDIY